MDTYSKSHDTCSYEYKWTAFKPSALTACFGACRPFANSWFGPLEASLLMKQRCLCPKSPFHCIPRMSCQGQALHQLLDCPSVVLRKSKYLHMFWSRWGVLALLIGPCSSVQTKQWGLWSIAFSIPADLQISAVIWGCRTLHHKEPSGMSSLGPLPVNCTRSCPSY